MRVGHVFLAKGADGGSGGGAEEKGAATRGGTLEIQEGVGEVGPGVFEEATEVMSRECVGGC